MNTSANYPLAFGGRTQAHIRLLILISGATVALSLYWQGRVAYFLFWDEGFFWYGVQRVMLGEVPIRDFMAYDPGRYYWSAAIMSIVGDNGIIAARLAMAFFQSIGLFFALWVVILPIRPVRAPHIVLAAVALGLWMYPHYKVFDATASIVLISAFAYLTDQPSHPRYILAGLVVGIAAWFGKNHGLYGVIGGLTLIGYLQVMHQGPSLLKSLGTWSLGIVIGYLPMLTMLIFIPGFAKAFWERSVRVIFEYGATNLPLPVPWPWQVDFRQLWINAAQDIFVGLFFLAVLGYCLLGIAILVRSILLRERLLPSIVASIIMAIPYAHYAFSRADISHLALGIFPLAIGLLSFFMQSFATVKGFGTMAFFVITMVTILPFHPGWKAWQAGDWPVIKVGGDVLVVDPGTAGAMKSIIELVDKYAPNGQEFISTPYWPGAYPAFGRKSPLWEIYALFPQSEEFQREEIERIRKAKPGFVLIFDYPLDSREENRYRNTHKVIDQFIRENYMPIGTNIPNHPFRIYIPK